MSNQAQNPNIKKLPKSPGIYLFYNAAGDLIYVGKATNLKSRVGSYFLSFRPSPKGERRNPLKSMWLRDSSTPLRFAQNDRTRPIENMIHEVVDIKWKETDSVLEAVILESIHIKKYQPKYNVLGKDDKSWNYIAITDDEYPQVIAVREHDIKNQKSKIKNSLGPYPNLKIREALKILRRLFKFSTCPPNQKRPCLYRQMGDCLGVCAGEITPADYKQKVIKPLTLFLQGKKIQVIKNLEKAMRRAAKNQEFEEAGRLRNQIGALCRFQDVALIGDNFPPKKEGEGGVGVAYRIEGYDISNISGASAVGAMVVFKDGESDKNQYRKFKIRAITQANDVGMLEEVLRRRLKNDWPLPDLILVDGGVPQVNTAKNVLRENNLDIPVVGIAKGPERKKNELIGLLPPGIDLKTLISIRDEAHRFAIAYHRKLRSRTLTENQI